MNFAVFLSRVNGTQHHRVSGSYSGSFSCLRSLFLLLSCQLKPEAWKNLKDRSVMHSRTSPVLWNIDRPVAELKKFDRIRIQDPADENLDNQDNCRGKVNMKPELEKGKPGESQRRKETGLTVERESAYDSGLPKRVLLLSIQRSIEELKKNP